VRKNNYPLYFFKKKEVDILAEKIKEIGEKAIKADVEELKKIFPDLLDTIKDAEVSDYIKVLKESPDLIIRGIPKAGEFINKSKPDDALPVIRETLPLIFDKVQKYGLEKFLTEVPDLAKMIPDIFSSMQKLMKEINPDKLTEFGRDFEDIMKSFFPLVNEGFPIVKKINKDIDDMFNKIKSAKVTTGVNLIDMGWGFRINWNNGEITLDSNTESDLTLELPTKSLFDMFEIMTSGSLSAALKAFTTGKIKIKGAMMKGAAILPLFTELGKLIKR